MRKLLLSSLLILLCFSTFSQWNPTTGPWGATINAYYGSEGTIYVVTGNFGAGGIFKSTDEGQSWELCNHGLPLTKKILGLYGDEDYIYVGIWQKGIYRSDDQGNSWSEVNNGLSESSLSVSAIYASDNKLYAGIFLDGMYVSDDQGDNWTQKSNGLEGAALRVNAITKSGNTLFIATPLGIYRSEDEGDNWISSSTGIPQSDIYCFDIEKKDNLLFACVLNSVYHSNDGGLNWVKLNGGVGTGGYTLAVHGNNIYTGANGLVYVSQDDGENWTSLGTGLPQFGYIYAIYASDISLLCGLDLYGSYRYDSENENWDPENSGLINTRVLDITRDGNDLFAGTLNADFGRIFKTGDNGVSWELSNNGSGDAGYHAIMSDDNFLLAGTDGDYIYRSMNQGESWEHITQPDFPASYVSSFCQNEGVVFAGSFGFFIDVYRSTDSGSTWINCNVPGQGDITAMHTSSDYVYTARTDGIYRSGDLGVSWVHTSDGLPDLPFINSIGSNDNFIFAAANNGLYRSPDQGDNWELILDYPYDQRILCISTVDNFLFTGTMKTGLLYSEDDGISWEPFNPEYFMDPEGIIPDVNAIEIKGDSIFVAYKDFGVWVSLLPNLTSTEENLQDSTRLSDFIKIYPNPFTISTTIEYSLSRSEKVSITFYNQFGKQEDRIEKKQSAGLQQIVWTPENLAVGIYYFSIKSERQIKTGKMILKK